MEIKPTYVTFEQAKWLKEKGFDVKCSKFYHEQSPLCTPEDYSLTIRDREMINDLSYAWQYAIPEQWQVIEWLRVKHYIWIELRYDYIVFDVKIHHPDRKTIEITSLLSDPKHPVLTTPQQAYSEAFDYIRENNLI